MYSSQGRFNTNFGGGWFQLAATALGAITADFGSEVAQAARAACKTLRGCVQDAACKRGLEGKRLMELSVSHCILATTVSE